MVELREERLLAHFILNAYWEELEFALPPTTGQWRRWIDTGLDSPEDIVPWREAVPVASVRYRARPRSVIVLFSDLKEEPGRPAPMAQAR
jgi:glycogen operon protein